LAAVVLAQRSSSSAHLVAARSIPDFKTAIAASISAWDNAVDMKGMALAETGVPP
jgi:predicted transcriptional regulator